MNYHDLYEVKPVTIRNEDHRSAPQLRAMIRWPGNDNDTETRRRAEEC